jgi:Domain of unknown function (DUF4150)
VFVNTNMGMMALGFPDVCKTPIGPVVVPLPYPNIFLGETAIPSQFIVLINCMPAHNMLTMTPITEGDEPGLLMGILSQLDMGTAQYEMGSFNLFVGGPPATKLTSVTGHNGILPNAPGVSIVPSQVTLLSLS